MSNKTSLYKKLKNNLDSFPHSRCLFFPDCIKFITPGSKNVYIDVTLKHCVFLNWASNDILTVKFN